MATAYTPLDLFRADNATSARFDHVRAKDVGIQIINGEYWVHAGTGGISTFERPLGLSGPWYRLPQGTLYDDAILYLRKSLNSGRWEWEPARNMLLTDYAATLARLNQEFIRV